MQSFNPIRMVMLGAPGAGKGTLSKRLLAKISQLSSISTGDLLRAQIAKNTDIGKTASGYIKSGKLLPDTFMANLLTAELSKKNWLNEKASFLLDGFPRTAGQAEQLSKALNPHKANINLVLELDVPPEVILDRIANRWIHPGSGRVYNLRYNPPKVPFKDDVTGEPLAKRADDNPETFKVRLSQYFKELKPIKQFYGKEGVLRTISGETSDIIFPKMLKLVEDEFERH